MVKGNSVTWGLCSRTIRLDKPQVLAYGNNTIAVGLASHSDNIIILDATTGSRVAVLSSHTRWVTSLVFSSDGRLLVSGSFDMTVKLWDIQTGGVVKTFCGHAGRVSSVSISADCTRIASGSWDCKICVWDIETGECHSSIKLQNTIVYVGFFPANSTSLISISGCTVQQWDTDGHQIGSTYNASYIAFTSDYTQLALCYESVVTLQNSDSGVPTARLCLLKDSKAKFCCFSPDGNLIAVASNKDINVWNVANSVPNFVGIFAAHQLSIASLVFSHHLLISTSYLEPLVKFWQVGILSIYQAATDLESNSSGLDGVQFVSLQTKKGIALTGDSYGTVIIWDILTGLYKKSFQTSARRVAFGDAQLIDDRFLVVWSSENIIYIWDSREGEHPKNLCSNSSLTLGVKISEDESKVFGLGLRGGRGSIIQAWSMWTWELVGEVEVGGEIGIGLYCFPAGGSRVWVKFEDLTTRGWDFDIPESSPVPVSNSMSERSHLDLIGGYRLGNQTFFKNTVTGKEVFRLSGKYAKPHCVSWDGQYLIVGYKDGELLILDFENLSF